MITYFIFRFYSSDLWNAIRDHNDNYYAIPKVDSRAHIGLNRMKPNTSYFLLTALHRNSTNVVQY